MPVLTGEMETLQHATGSFKFSGVKIENLDESEYTLVGIAVDNTPSVDGFADDLLNALKEAIRGCRRSPRKNNLLVRVTYFNSYGIKEIHGFKPLSLIDENSDYPNFATDGMTNLCDAGMDIIGSTVEYGKRLIDDEYIANGIDFIITDGLENASRYSKEIDIANEQKKITQSEQLESLVTVLVGVNASLCKDDLNSFKTNAGLTQYVDIDDFDEKQSAKLANFISSSVSGTSQSLGSCKSLTADDLMI